MKHILHKTISSVLAGVMLLLCAGCAAETEQETYPVYTSYLDIPGITDEDIETVNALRNSREYFVYGMESTTESFIREDGSIGGFTSLITGWLSELFEIPFIPVIYEWNDLLEGLETHTIDFTGDLTPTQERINIYYMTSPIVARPITKLWHYDKPPPIPADITPERPMRYIFNEGAVAYGLTLPYLEEHREVIFVSNNTESYQLLSNGMADILIEEAPYEAYFDKYGGLATEQFFPLTNSTVSITTKNPELRGIIEIIQKALDNGARRCLTELYSQGYHQYQREKLSKMLTEEERAYIQAHIESNEPIPVGMEFDNYPTSFYNTREGQWQGIAFDVLTEIEKLTDLSFIINHHSKTSFSRLLDLMDNGKIALISEVIPTIERTGMFLFSNPYASDYYALISLTELEDAELNDILYRKVGLQNDVAYTEVFWQWFPNHPNTVPLVDAFEAIDALERREIEMFMGTRKHLLQATNYLEKPGFKTNIVFNYGYDSTYGISLNEPELHSIINKAMQLIDTNRINERWVTRVFNYQSIIARERMPFLIGSSVLLLAVTVLLIVMFNKGRRQNVLLSAAVAERTRELEKQMKIAVSASESKSRFLATMSHEIRTPMNAIIGITELELQNDDIPNTDAFEKIYSSSISLLGIINDILDMSKIETGKLELNIAEYDLPSLINDATQLNAVRIGSKPINFVLDIDETLPSKLKGDELRLKQILNNLLSNAVKYTDEGQIKLTVSITDTDDDTDNNESTFLTFIVSDTGHGMKPEDVNRLFTEYLRFYAGANRSTEGTGLGLHITKSLVEMMDGTITVESRFGEGSTFTVTVRQGTLECQPIGANVARSLRGFTYNSDRRVFDKPIERRSMPHGRVLVVDDVESNLYVAGELLKLYNLQVETVTSGYKALEKINTGRTYDIIFMDHMMPKMDGIETTHKLRRLGYHGAVIALTANAIVGNDEMFKENGFDGFISKPIDNRRLDKILNEHIPDDGSHPGQADDITVTVEEPVSQTQIPQQLLRIFCREAEIAVETLRNAADNKDYEKIVFTAHSMKSALANINEQALSDQAAQLEAAGKSDNLALIDADIENFISALDNLIKFLRNNSPPDDSTGSDSGSDFADSVLLREQSEVLIEACGNFDAATAFAALEQMHDKKWAPEVADTLEQIYNALYQESDFEKAAVLAGEIVGLNS